MAEQTAARVVRVSRSPGADVWAGPVTLDEVARPRFTLHAAGVEAGYQLAVHGDHQVSNALCAAAVALECGATGEQVADRAGRRRARCRGTACTSPPASDGVTVIDDAYNANPDSMLAGLKSLAWMARQGGRNPAQLGGARRDGRARRRRDIGA